MTKFEIITEKLGFNPLIDGEFERAYKRKYGEQSPATEDEYPSLFSVLSFEEKMFLDELFKMIRTPA